MSNNIESIAEKIRDYAKTNSFPLDVAAAMIFDTKYNQPGLFKDEFSRIGHITTNYTRKTLYFELFPEIIRANLIELYEVALQSIGEAGYIAEPKPLNESILSLSVKIKKENKQIGVARIMHDSKPRLGKLVGYDTYGGRTISFDNDRGIAFEFGEDQQEAAIKILHRYYENTRRFEETKTTDN
jgi:hypothetical protein